MRSDRDAGHAALTSVKLRSVRGVGRGKGFIKTLEKRSISVARKPAPARLVEVQGLRTVAALLVACYHIWFQRVSGGVDVFFVIAGYFMAMSLMKPDQLGGSQVVSLYLQTFRRVLPGAATVIVATMLAVLVICPPSLLRSELAHAGSSLLFVENWHLASEGADYLNQGLVASAFQQMWALSLIVQFYLSLPLVMLLGSHLAERSGISKHAMLVTILAVIFAASFAYSVWLTAVDQPRAYFHSGARAWEFVAGALLALTAAQIKLRAAAAKLLGLGALVLLIVFGRLVDVADLFPGYVALVPVAIGASIILAARNGGAIPVLTWRPLVWAGDYSFTFYLWHWPILTFVRILTLDNQIGSWMGLAIIIGAAALAFVTTKYVEVPFRRNERLSSSPMAAFAGCLALMALAGIAVTGAAQISSYQGDHRVAASAIMPDPAMAKADNPRAYSDGCHQTAEKADLIACTYGKPGSDTTIVLVGGSHSTQWLPALEAVAAKNGFKIISMTKSACSFAAGARAKSRNKSCASWTEAAMAEIIRLRPDLVFTTATRRGPRGDVVPDGYLDAWRILETNRIGVLALRDNPWFRFEIPLCVEMRGAASQDCGAKRSAFYSETTPAENVKLGNVYFADLSEEFCPGGFCPSVRDGILRYRDKHHLTQTYVTSLAPLIEAELFMALKRVRTSPGSGAGYPSE